MDPSNISCLIMLNIIALSTHSNNIICNRHYMASHLFGIDKNSI